MTNKTLKINPNSFIRLSLNSTSMIIAFFDAIFLNDYSILILQAVKQTGKPIINRKIIILQIKINKTCNSLIHIQKLVRVFDFFDDLLVFILRVELSVCGVEVQINLVRDIGLNLSWFSGFERSTQSGIAMSQGLTIRYSSLLKVSFFIRLSVQFRGRKKRGFQFEVFELLWRVIREIFHRAELRHQIVSN